MSLNFGSVVFEGNMYEDKMCLYQTRNDRKASSGKMCVHSQKFVAINNIIGEFTANGVLGLAPVAGNYSYVENLFNQG
jgi:hypothetical protein